MTCSRAEKWNKGWTPIPHKHRAVFLCLLGIDELQKLDKVYKFMKKGPGPGRFPAEGSLGRKRARRAVIKELEGINPMLAKDVEDAFEKGIKDEAGVY